MTFRFFLYVVLISISIPTFAQQSRIYLGAIRGGNCSSPNWNESTPSLMYGVKRIKLDLSIISDPNIDNSIVQRCIDPIQKILEPLKEGSKILQIKDRGSDLLIYRVENELKYCLAKNFPHIHFLDISFFSEESCELQGLDCKESERNKAVCFFNPIVSSTLLVEGYYRVKGEGRQNQQATIRILVNNKVCKEETTKFESSWGELTATCEIFVKKGKTIRIDVLGTNQHADSLETSAIVLSPTSYFEKK